MIGQEELSLSWAQGTTEVTAGGRLHRNAERVPVAFEEPDGTLREVAFHLRGKGRLDQYVRGTSPIVWDIKPVTR